MDEDKPSEAHEAPKGMKIDFKGFKLPKLKSNKVAAVFGGIITAVIILAIIVTFFNVGMKISGSAAEGKAETYITGNFLAERGMSAEATGVRDTGSYYEVSLNILQGEAVQDVAVVYVSKDGGSLLLGQLFDLTEAPASITGATTQEPVTPTVTKSDKPKVEAFVFSYCPYGLQFEKALLSVYRALKDKSDIELVAIGAMHGEYEKVESLRQICIEKEYSTDKMWGYLEKFMGDTELGDCRGAENCVKPIIEKIFIDLSIDKSKINSCMETDAEGIYQSQNSRAEELGIGGSPTFVINNVKVQVERTPESIREAICSAFNEAPGECEQELSTQAASPGFGYSDSSSSSGGSC